MSASQEKKLRQQLRAEGKDKRELARIEEEQTKKRNRLTWSAVGLLLALSIVALIVFQSNLLYRNFTAVQIGDTSYTAAEYSFFYRLSYSQFVQQMGGDVSALGLDSSLPLSAQKLGDQSASDFFKNLALTSMQEVTALYDEAKREGFELNEEQKEELANEIKAFEEVYALNGHPSVNSFISANYGKGTNLNIVSDMIEKMTLSNAYSQHKYDSFTYPAEEIDAKYQAEKDAFDSFSFLSNFISGSAEEGQDEAAAMAEAKKTAEAIVAKGDSEESFIKAAKDESDKDVSVTTLQGSSLSEIYADWLKSASRKPGDTTVIETETGPYALYFIGRDDNSYKTVNVRHILVKAEADADGNFSATAKTAAMKAAEDLLKDWKAGPATEDSFAALATEKSEDQGSSANGGLYEAVTKGRMVAEFNDWCFDEARKPGDSGIVYGESGSYAGYHVMYFSGLGDSYRDTLVDNNLRNADFSAWKTDLVAGYEAKTGFTASLVR